jgi:chemotaxis protein MotB
LPNAVRVEGHTDNVPIRNALFYSNWELSAARAGSVVHVLSANGVAPNRLAVVGFGEQRPSHSNDTAQGRNANRRVVVVILSTDPAHANDPLGWLRTPSAPDPTAQPAPPGSAAAVSSAASASPTAPAQQTGPALQAAPAVQTAPGSTAAPASSTQAPAGTAPASTTLETRP